MKDAGKAAAPTHLFDLKQGQYSDGSPLDEVHYLESKIILKPDRFTSAKVFLEFGELVQGACRKCGVAFSRNGVVLKPQLREVLFLDTADFTLYKNAFILRRRILYQDGFPVGDPEIVFKFRHPDIQTAAEMDVRPDFAGDYRIKFKAEGLPLHDQVGGCRLLFSHNAQFGLSQMPEAALSSMSALARTLPALRALKAPGAERVGIVNDTIVEEVQQNLGSLDLGAGIVAEANVALWRERSAQRPICAEFPFEAKFKRGDALHDKTAARQDNGPGQAVVRRRAAIGARLALPGHNENGAGLPPQRRSRGKPGIGARRRSAQAHRLNSSRPCHRSMAKSAKWLDFAPSIPN